MLSALDGSATVSDRRTGNLLFYTDGLSIWNARHQVMPNGMGLLGHNSSTQTALIVPVPGDDSLYYVFTAGAGSYVLPEDDHNGIRYTVVDMRKDGGLGAVDPARKNIMMLAPATEKLTATRHCGGRDYWVLAHDWGTNAFYAYRLSGAGIIDTVVSNVGTVHTRDPQRLKETGANCSGAMKISPDGRRIAVAGTGLQLLEVFDFDPSTGEVSNPLDLGVVSPDEFYGVSFSPDNTKLYATTANPDKRPYRLLQFDLAAGDATAIRGSMTVVASAQGAGFGMIQVGPDEQLYVTYRGSETIGVIINPDSLAPACNYNPAGVTLPRDIKTGQGLPNFIDCDVVGVDDLKLSLSNDPSVKLLHVGDLVTFTLRVCNNYSCTIGPVTIRDSLPAGLEYFDGVSDYPWHTFDSLRPGECRSVWLRTRVLASAPRNVPITDCAIISSSSPERGIDETIDSCADVMVIDPITPEADIGVLCTADNTTPGRGGTVNYTVDLFNLGPSAGTGIIARDKLPAGVRYTSYVADMAGVAYDPASGDISIPSLAVGDTVRLTISCVVDSAGIGDIENCVELLTVVPADNNSTNNNSCVTISPRWCNAPELTAHAHIPDSLSTSFDHDLVAPVVLDDSLDQMRVTRLRFRIGYDSTIARIVNQSNLKSLTEGTLLAGWRIISIDSTRGDFVIELAAPDAASFVRGTGVLLALRLRMYLGHDYSTPLPISIEFPGNPCVDAIATPGSAHLDSLCGLQLRLIEMTGPHLKLLQNIPNPFNPSTGIAFAIGLDGPARLDVLNARGEVVAVLADEYMQSGEYMIRWDASAMPSGFYYCRLQSAEWTRIISMLLVK
jgi:uncharacterized repeat protein (TIGR01451 family)